MSEQASSVPAASSNGESVSDIINVLGSPSASSPILESLIINAYAAPGSIRTYTPLKVLSQGPFSSLHLCHWHSILPPRLDAPPLPTIARYGVGRDLIVLKIIPIDSNKDPNKVKELEVRG